MASMRGISKRLNLFPKQLRPSFAHILHGDSDETMSSPPTLGSSFNKVFSFESYRGNSGLVALPQGKHCLSFAQPVGFGFMFCRYMSSKPENWSDKFNSIGSVADGVAPEKIVEAAPNQVPEVAVVASDSLSSDAVFQNFIDGVHSFTGLNWWASIVLSILLLQASAIPLFLGEPAFSHAQNQITKLEQELNSKAMDVDDRVEVQEKLHALNKEFEAKLNMMMIYAFCHTSTNIIAIGEVKDMARRIPSFQSGGTLWLTDLSAPDSFCILPVLSMLIMWIAFECKFWKYEGDPSIEMGKKFHRVAFVLFIPFVVKFETVEFFCLLPYSLFALSSEFAMRHPKVKKLLDFPDMRPLPFSSLFEDETPEKPQACSEPSKSDDSSTSSKSVLTVTDVEKQVNHKKDKKN